MVSKEEDKMKITTDRLKEIIKTGGVNVSPLEVEGIILKHPNVKQAFVLGVPHKQKT